MSNNVFGFDETRKTRAQAKAVHLYPNELLDGFDILVNMLEQEAEQNGFELNSIVRTAKVENGYDASCLSWGPNGIIDDEIVEYRFVRQ